jgi:hypothetical protein
MTPNPAMERTADPRHASCVRTWRATDRGPLIAIVRAQTRISEREEMIIDRGCRLAADAA